MYSPDLFSNDLYSLWNNDRQTNLSLYSSHKKSYPPHQYSTNNNHQENNNTNEHSDEVNRQMRSLFAPPLSAYSAEYTGASLSQLENTIRASHRPGLPLLSTSIQRKLERAKKIRNYGFSTLKPIGIDKTMEQIELEEARQYNISDQSEDQSFVHTAENSNGNIPESSIDGANYDLNAGDQNIEDLDAHIPNIDSDEDDYDEFEDEFEEEEEQEELDDHAINEDEGFMAEDVEYQDDHSINTNSVSNMLVNSAFTSSTMTSATNNSNRSIGTLPTTIPSALSMTGNNSSSLYSVSRIREANQTRDENDYANENGNSFEDDDNSELDMVVDEN